MFHRRMQVLTMKLLLEEKDSRRAAEIGKLIYGNLSIRDWLSKYPAGLISNLTRRAIRSSSEYSALKTAVKIISEHDLKVAVCGKDRESDTFRLVYRKAHVGERIWRVQNCALAVVLKAVLDASGGGQTFAVVGEVFWKSVKQGTQIYDLGDNILIRWFVDLQARPTGRWALDGKVKNLRPISGIRSRSTDALHASVLRAYMEFRLLLERLLTVGPGSRHVRSSDPRPHS